MSQVVRLQNLPRILATGILEHVPFPLAIDRSSRHLVDQDGKPFLLVGDAAWSLFVSVSDQDADFYFQNRKRHGFNAALVNLLEHKSAADPPRNFYGISPFTGRVFTTPNEAYFLHVDYMVQSAYAHGMVLLIAPLYIGAKCGDYGWCADAQAASATELRAWGEYVGRRY